MAFAQQRRARLLLGRPRAGLSNDAAGFASCRRPVGRTPPKGACHSTSTPPSRTTPGVSHRGPRHLPGPDSHRPAALNLTLGYTPPTSSISTNARAAGRTSATQFQSVTGADPPRLVGWAGSTPRSGHIGSAGCWLGLTRELRGRAEGGRRGRRRAVARGGTGSDGAGARAPVRRGRLERRPERAGDVRVSRPRRVVHGPGRAGRDSRGPFSGRRRPSTP